MKVKTPIIISIIWVIVSPILFFWGFGSVYVFPLNIIVSAIIMPIFPILFWVIYFVSLIIKRNKTKKQNEYNTVINTNAPSQQDKRLAVNNIQAKRLVFASIFSSSATLIFTIITVIIIGQVQKRSSGYDALVLLNYWYLFLIIVALEIVSVILALLSSIRTKKIQKMYRNFIKQKKLYLIKKILFIIVLLWPLLYILAGAIIYPIINL